MVKHLFRFGYDCYDWIAAENIEQAVSEYKSFVGEENYQMELKFYLEGNPENDESDFLMEFVSIEDEEKELLTYDDGSHAKRVKMKVKDILANITNVPAYSGSSEY